jgi:6-phosphogluconolactonase
MKPDTEPSPSASIAVFPDVPALALAAAADFLALANEAIGRRDVFSVALSGGSTPSTLYRLLATDPTLASRVPWSAIHFFFGDERHVPPDHADSNFRMVNQAMFQSLAHTTIHAHRIRGEIASAQEAAAQYEADLREFFTSHRTIVAGFPRFDLILLGIGADGHTASLFPGTAGLEETRSWVIANRVDKLGTDRISLTFPVLNNAGAVTVFVAGAEKASVVADVLDRAPDALRYPIQRVKPRDGSMRWMLDRAAASGLPETISGVPQTPA